VVTDGKTILEHYEEKFDRSKALYERAKGLFPSGVTHDARYMEPFPIYVERAYGPHKWTVEEHRLVDYWTGHGALLLGHNHPEVMAAMAAQVTRGTHYGACHEQELEWAELIREMVPSVEKVRFTGSGTEATLMAIRLCRAFTGKHKILRFEGHFHGWHDNVMIGWQPPYEVPSSPGILHEVLDSAIVVESNDADAVEEVLSGDDDVACVILEPCGAGTGIIPTKPGFPERLREITQKRDVPLIYDEVVTGFRMAPGGAQEYQGITPDVSTMAKILAGGMPGGAVGGRADIMELLEFREGQANWNRYEKMAHPGTYNANPLSAAAGAAALRVIRDTDACDRAAEHGQKLREGINEIIDRLGLHCLAYGERSRVNLLLAHNEDCSARDFDIERLDYRKKPKVEPKVGFKLRCGLLVKGVDISGTGILAMSCHTDEDLAAALEAFEWTLGKMKEEGDLS